jgi:serine protease AprX
VLRRWAIATLAAAGAAAALAAPPEDNSQLYWIFFADRGAGEADFADRVADASRRLTPAARARRARAGYVTPLDPWDLAPPAAYVAAAEAAAGSDAVVRSRWLNAVAVPAGAEAARRVAALPFVGAVAPVAGRPAPDLPAGAGYPEGRDEFHGLAYEQLSQIQVTLLHDEGYWGDGVTVGVLDTGFNLSHESLWHTRVIAARDFTVQGDWRADQGGHGTAILSVLGGIKPGVFVGAAPNAYYILGKTELVEPEREVEEHWYVAGMEWAEALGADVLSTSLGYMDWYSYADMDGNTAVTTRAANVACAKGLVVVTANGNEGENERWPWMIAPADGYKTLGVGAVDKEGAIAPWSSRGPTYDGRVKPDVCARGVDTWCARTKDPHGYFASAGTSLATPLAAGAAALVIQKRPDLSPDEIRMALTKTATRATSPGNAYGFGIVQARDAGLFEPTSVPPAEKPRLALSFPPAFSPNGDGRDDVLEFAVKAADADGITYWQLAVSDADDPFAIRKLFFGSGPVDARVAWNGGDLAGRTLPPGTYRAILSAWDRRANLAVRDGGTFRLNSAAKSAASARAYPNPFARSRGHRLVHFAALPAGAEVEVYDLAGARVWGGRSATGGEISWGATAADGGALAAGVYLYRIRAGGEENSGKIAILE